MNFIPMNQEIKDLRNQIIAQEEELRKARATRTKEVTRVFAEAWAKYFSRFKYEAFASGFTESRLQLHSVVGCGFIEGGGWGIQDPEDERGFGRETRGPVSFSDVLRCIKEVEAENPGLVIEIVPLKLRKNGKNGDVLSFRTIELQHQDKEVVLKEKGEIWRTGWDIPDRYIVAAIDGERWVWWSMDGHGGPMVHSAKHDTPEWALFEAFRKKRE